MRLLQSLRIMGAFMPRRLVGLVAIAPLLASSVALAQNQSDVTGPNLSDVTGPNLSDVTGPNLSDNTGVLGISIFGEESGLSDFFEEFGNELEIDSRASLAEQLRQAQKACLERALNLRRFAREPEPGAEVSPACAEFNRLIQRAQGIFAQPNYSPPNSQPTVDQRIW